MQYAIEAEGLVKRFGATLALDGVELRRSRPARCSGCSGPTAPARRPRSGSWPRCWRPTPAAPAWRGYDVVTEAAEVRRAVGLTGQYASVDEALTGRQNLVMIGQLLDLSARRGQGPGGRAARPGSA